MREVAPIEQWRTYAICDLQVNVHHPLTMPLDDMLEACGRERLAEAMDGEEEGARADRRAQLPLNVTRTMLLKQANAEVAPIEAALIHCSSMGSATLNSASYGGLDTLSPAVVIPAELEGVRERVTTALGPRRAAQQEFDLQVLARARELYVLAAGFLAIQHSPQLLAASAIYAALPGRTFHILKDITLEDLQGQATRFGPFARPGLSQHDYRSRHSERRRQHLSHPSECRRCQRATSPPSVHDTQPQKWMASPNLCANSASTALPLSPLSPLRRSGTLRSLGTLSPRSRLRPSRP